MNIARNGSSRPPKAPSGPSRIFPLGCVAPLFAFLQSITLFANDWDVRLVGTCECSPSQMAVAGNYLYATVPHWGLEVIDISDPRHPVVATKYQSTNYINGVALAGANAYLAAGTNGLEIVDISNPPRVNLVGYCSTGGMGYQVAVSKDAAYVEVIPSSVAIVDIRNRAEPRVVNVLTNLRVFEMVVEGGFLYTDSQRGLLQFDITDPFHPRQTATNGAPGGSWFAVRGRYACIGGAQRFAVIDFSDEAHPIRRGSCELAGYLTSVTLSGDYAYVGLGTEYMLGLEIVDIRDPDNPRAVGRYSTDWEATCVAVSGNYAYLSLLNELLVLDIGQSANPQRVGEYQASFPSTALAVQNNYAYLANDGGQLDILDVSDGTSPKLVRRYEAAGGPDGDPAYGVAVANGYAYLAAWQGGLRILDVSHPANPALLGSYATNTMYAWSVAICGNYAYVGDAALHVFDVSGPTNPVPIGNCAMPGGSWRIVLSDAEAYVCSAGLQIVDTINIFNPQILGSFGTDPTWGFALAGNYGYVVHSGRKFEVLDMSDPINPRSVGLTQLSGEGLDVGVWENYAYVPTLKGVGGRTGLDVVDISDPTHPKRVGGNSAFFGFGVVVNERGVYVEASLDGLAILPHFTPLADAALRLTGPAGGVGGTFQWSVQGIPNLQVGSNGARICLIGRTGRQSRWEARRRC